MKKVFTIVLIVGILVISLFILSGCRNEKIIEDSIVEVDLPKYTEENLIDWMENGTFTIEFTLSSVNTLGENALEDDEELLPVCSMSVQGNNVAISMYKGIRTIFLDMEVYIIDDINKTIAETSYYDVGFPTSFQYMQIKGSGVGTIDDKEFYYENFEQGGFSDYKLKFYMDFYEQSVANIYAIEADNEIITTTMIIKSAKNTVPEGIFDIPTDEYTNI